MKKLYIVLTMMFIMVAADLSAQVKIIDSKDDGRKETIRESFTIEYTKVNVSDYDEVSGEFIEDTELSTDKQSFVIYNFKGKNSIKIIVPGAEPILLFGVFDTYTEDGMQTGTGYIAGKEVTFFVSDVSFAVLEGLTFIRLIK